MVKFRRWYSGLPSNRTLIKQILTGLQLLIFGLAGILSTYLLELIKLSLPISIYNSVYTTMAAISLTLFSTSLLYSVFVVGVLAMTWFIPPTAFEIGDEVKEIKNGRKIREFILVTVFVGLIIGIVSGILQDLFFVDVFQLKRRGWSINEMIASE